MKKLVYEEITVGAPIGHRPKGMRLTSRDKVFILWGRYEELSMRAIAERLPAALGTVNAYLTRVRTSPRIALELPLYQFAVLKSTTTCRKLKTNGQFHFEIQLCEYSST